MADKHSRRGLPASEFDTDDRALWNELGDLPPRRPGERLRHEFYQHLAHAQRPRRDWFAWLRQPLVPAALSLLVGLGLGSRLTAPEVDQRFDDLQQQVQTLNTSLALNLMQNAAIGDRLSGIELAAGLNDQRVDQALLVRAQQDRSQSVRSAALAALGPRVSERAIWQELRQLLTETESPLVQLALADQIMRWGEPEQLEHLATASSQSQLLPEVNTYVQSKLEPEPI